MNSNNVLAYHTPSCRSSKDTELTRRISFDILTLIAGCAGSEDREFGWRVRRPSQFRRERGYRAEQMRNRLSVALLKDDAALSPPAPSRRIDASPRGSSAD